MKAAVFKYDCKPAGTEKFSYDAWGNSRDPYTWTGTNTLHPMFDRGFTGHEHLFDFGLINMNGRMYDPVMSGFLSVDNYVQAPDNSQNFNRYAYCLNNPLKYTDPSGEVFGADDAAILLAVGVAATVASSVTLNGLSNLEHGQPFFQNAGRVALIGAMQGCLSFAIGGIAETITTNVWGQMAFRAGAHYLVGGCSTAARGGDFADGAAASLASSLVCGGVKLLGFNNAHLEAAVDIAGGTLAGGVAEHIMGGDFVDGAFNGFVCAGLNHAMHLVMGNSGGPDDPPSQNSKSNKINKPNHESIEGASTVVAGGVALGQGAAELSKITFLKNGLEHLGLTFAGINLFNNFYKTYQGEITIESAIMRSFVGYVEMVSARIPYIGPVVSITLSCYDAGGGFDNTIYSNQWWHQLGGNHSSFYSEYCFWKLQQEYNQVR